MNASDTGASATSSSGRNLEKFHADMARAPAERGYLILFTPRSGSTWIAKILYQSGRFGRPNEYLNPDVAPLLMEWLNAGSPADLMAMLIRKRQTANRVFGLKATSAQIARFGEEALFAGLPRELSVFLLWRRNLAAQAISLYRAVTTGRYHAFNDASGKPAPVYDAEAIRGWMWHVLNIENANCLLVRRRRLAARSIAYEDIVGDAEATLALFADVEPTNLPPRRRAARPPPSRPETERSVEKIGDDWNEEAERRFRAENARFVRSVEAQRLVLRLAADGRPSNPAFMVALGRWGARRAVRRLGLSLGFSAAYLTHRPSGVDAPPAI